MFTTKNSIEAMRLFSEKISANKKYLNELDRFIGDGDHGDNLVDGLANVMTCLATQKPTTLAAVFKLIGTTFIREVGGAAGALYGSAFLAMSQASTSTNQTIALLEAGLLGIKERGHATLGEKTLIDLWEPAIEQLKKNKLEAATLAVFVEKSKALVAMKGRAACLGEASIGQIDPGMMSSKYLFEALLESGCLK